MTDQELRDQGPPTTLDNTIRSTYADCPRKLYWFLRRFEYANRPAYFTFGAAWQEILLEWYSQDKERGPTERFAICCQKGLDYWDKAGEDGSAPNNKENLLSMFAYYVQKFPSEPWHVIAGESGWEWPLATINGTEYFLGGSLDGYVDWPGYGILCLENKTTGMYLTDSFLNQWSFSPQVTGYIWALTRMQGKEIFGALMNLASKRNMKEPDKRFTRTLEKRNEDQLQQFERDWIYFIEELERAWFEWVWPLATNAINCAGGIGRSPCQYRPLCAHGAPIRSVDPNSIPSLVESKELWKPWAREGEQKAKTKEA